MSSFSGKPKRKHRSDYSVSEYSKLTGCDFAYNNRLSSRLYDMLKVIQRIACNRSTYIRLQGALYKAVRDDRIHDLGSLRLGYGDVSPLKGFRFSLKTSLGRFFMNAPVAEFNEEKNSLEMRISLRSLHRFSNVQERLAKLLIKMYCIVIQVNEQNNMAIHASKDLELLSDHPPEDRSIFFPLQGSENAVVLCLVTVRSWLTTPDGTDQFLSNDSTLMTGEVFDAMLIRDGKRVIFPKEVSKGIPPPIQPVDNEIDWN